MPRLAPTSIKPHRAFAMEPQLCSSHQASRGCPSAPPKVLVLLGLLLSLFLSLGLLHPTRIACRGKVPWKKRRMPCQSSTLADLPQRCRFGSVKTPRPSMGSLCRHSSGQLDQFGVLEPTCHHRTQVDRAGGSKSVPNSMLTHISVGNQPSRQPMASFPSP